MYKQVFVNVCFSESIQSFSQQKKLDDEGKEQEVHTLNAFMPDCVYQLISQPG